MKLVFGSIVLHIFVLEKFSVGPAGTCPSGPIQYSGHLSSWYREVVRFKVRKTVIMWLMLLMCGMKKVGIKVVDIYAYDFHEFCKQIDAINSQ